MNFYRISPVISTSWVSIIKLKNEDDVQYHVCTRCGFKELMSWEDFHPVFECESVTGKRRLPDLMLYGGQHWHAYHLWKVVSEKFKDFFENNGYKGAYFTPVDLVYKYRNSYKPIEERYYILNITGKGKLDYEKAGYKKRNCEECHMCLYEEKFPISSKDKKGIYEDLVKLDTWDGSDVFGKGWCTAGFAKEVLEAGLTGIQFCNLKFRFAEFDMKHYIRKASKIEVE